MTRITDALKRARSAAAAGPLVDESLETAPIPFFAPGQPALVSPWDLQDEPAVEFDRPRPSHADSGPSTFFIPSSGIERDRESSGKDAEKLVTAAGASRLARAQYSKLAAGLHQLQLDRGIKAVMLTSAGPAEGKTLTVANLALTLAEAYQRRVLLIDADLRSSTLHEVFDVSNAQGLSDLLSVNIPLPLLQVSPLLSVLTAGDGRGDPMKTLTSDRMRALLVEARRRFDWVLLDTPPVGLLPDAKLLAAMTDGVLLVALAGKTPYDEIQNAADAFDANMLLGVVLNRVKERAMPRSYAAEYYADQR